MFPSHKYTCTWIGDILLTSSQLIFRYYDSSNRRDYLVNMNYAIFLYNQGDKKSAAKQFKAFEQKFKIAKQNDPSSVDQEVKYHLSFCGDCKCSKACQSGANWTGYKFSITIRVWIDCFKGNITIRLKCFIYTQYITLQSDDLNQKDTAHLYRQPSRFELDLCFR